ncbi:MAG: zinc ABC transporter substrate-binding protein [Bacteroidales bacterium]
MRTLARISHLLVILMALTTGFWGCSQPASSDDKPVISVSVMPLKYFVDRLTNEELEVNVMVPQGASHATYSPTARQMQQLSDSDIYLRISSLGYEQAFIHRLDEMNDRMSIVELTQGLELIRGMEKHGDHYHEGGIDPHVWMSPQVMMNILPAIKQALVQQYPDMAIALENNFSLLMQEVEQVHQEFQQLVPTLSQRRFMIFHPALSYLARDYNLEQVAIEHEGKEPSPQQLERLVREARAEDIPVIFIQEEFDLRNATLVSQETGAEVVQINPLAYNWTDSMHQLLETFRKHLQ